MMPSLAYFVGLLALTGAAVARPFESINGVPKGWSYLRTPAAEDFLQLRVSLRQQNLAHFEQLVLDMSTPDHPRYGQHLARDEVRSILSPAPDASAAVIRWLETNGVPAHAHEGEWVTFWTDVATANRLLDTNFVWYENDARGERRLRTTEYAVPEEVARHINFVEPTIKFPSLRPMRSSVHAVGAPKKGDADALATYMEWKETAVNPAATVPPDAVCNVTITPQCLLGLYNIHYGASSSNGASVSYGSFLNEFARNTDLTVFETEIAMYAMGQSFSVTSFNGGGNNQTSTDDSTEANLDNQYIVSVAYPLPVTEFSTAGCGPQNPDPNEPAGACDNEPYMQFLSGILALPDASLPQTLSVSYGDDEQTWPLSMAQQVCNGFMQLGARGVSVMFASGDSGPGAICENNDGSMLQFVPAFPASCPYVTAVGATQYVAPEQAADFSGGGFSNYFAQPSYQSTAVAKYLKGLGSKQAAYFNASGRGYPDVSAQGVDYLVVNTGATEPVDGTSCASPTFASVIALLNSARISAGLAPLGFLNPFLYSSGYTALNDITLGGSVGCDGSSGTIPYASWNATSGWDPVTGLGTPDFGKLLALVAPSQCNIGGVVANPSITSCAPVTTTSTTTSSTSKSTSTSTTTPTSTSTTSSSSTSTSTSTSTTPSTTSTTTSSTSSSSTTSTTPTKTTTSTSSTTTGKTTTSKTTKTKKTPSKTTITKTKKTTTKTITKKVKATQA